MSEIWKPIPNWPGYFAGSNGEILSRKRYPDGQVLRSNANWGGYLMVYPRKEGKTYGRLVHRLVAYAFLGPRPSKRHEINHINGDKLDNRACNLEWVTPLENMAHAKCHGLRPKGSTVWSSQIDETIAARVKRLLLDGVGATETAQRLGVSYGVVSGIKYGGNWAHVQPESEVSE